MRTIIIPNSYASNNDPRNPASGYAYIIVSVQQSSLHLRPTSFRHPQDSLSMSSTTQSSPPRAGSYILVSSTANLDEPETIPGEVPRSSSSRPRLFFLLPLVAALDVATALTLGILVLTQLSRHDEPAMRIMSKVSHHDPLLTLSSLDPENSKSGNAAWERRKIVVLVMAFSVARACAYAIVGFSKRIRQLGVTVAAISILSTLFYVSVANLLFQARPKPGVLDTPNLSWSSIFASDTWRWPDAFRHFEPTMPILVGAQMAFTLLEWILYIAIVGVKVPPGGNPVQAKRWARDLAQDPQFRRGVDAQSLYPSDDGQEATAAETEHSAGGSHTQTEANMEQGRAQLSSPISNPSRGGQADGSEQPLLGASPTTPRGYGSILTEQMTPQAQGSVRSARSPAAAPSQGMSRSASARSGLYSKSPGAAELGVGGIHAEALEDEDDEDDEHRDGEGDEEAEGSDPDDIIDITPNRAVARKEARLRLARAALPERRASGGTLSTLSIFGGGAGGSSGDAAPSRNDGGGAQGVGVFSDEAGSPIARNNRGETSAAPLLMVGASDEPTRAESAAADTSMQSSNSMTLPSSSSTRTVSTRASSFKDRKFKLPKWIKRGSKKGRMTDHDV
ncbi:hypothetical protein PHSY_004707 [Pseudozyma hubeiensis SY62]|uniref:Uncharacterized protein n=1 Tax=Pseudozyma hubeiensis (strain SY62) TaxID=1305764 RepID=R9P792_PSEHS|nr:hypothetical protein PHSY_004707 [Pseudozyma hubeiensis SY62]GAC97122.1 hypothetical protein PHSY_004707 [Pseudozyma hubeiensis SY62]